MISVLSYNNDNKEAALVKSQIRNVAAKYTDERWEIFATMDLNEVQKYVMNSPIINMAFYDVASSESIGLLKEIRAEYKDMLLMLIADTSLSPMEYVRPDIMASHLLLRPFRPEDLLQRIKEVVFHYLDGLREENDAFFIESVEGKTRVPYSQILYFESRSKKIYVRLANREFPFYDTLENLEKRLPEQFVRCHRGFIVNMMHIEHIYLSQSYIELFQGIEVPLSRSYKGMFKSFR